MAFSYLLAEKISCSAELSMKKVFLTSGPDALSISLWSLSITVVKEVVDYAFECSFFIALDKALFFNQKVSIVFSFLNKNICCWYSLEAPHQGTSNEYPQHMFLLRNRKTMYLIPTLI